MRKTWIWLDAFALLGSESLGEGQVPSLSTHTHIPSLLPRQTQGAGVTDWLVSLQLRSRDGSEYLIQHDSEAIISTWHKAIAKGIEELVGRAWDLQG